MSGNRVFCLQGNGVNGSINDSPFVASVPALPNVIGGGGGQYHICGITPTYGLRCWGYNNNGQV